MSLAAAPSTADAVALLRTLVEGTTFGALKSARPITFWLDGEAVTLDPRQSGLIVQGAIDNPALTLRTQPAVLVRLLTSSEMWLGPDERLAFEGDPKALAPLIEALQGGKNPLLTRMGAMKR